MVDSNLTVQSLISFLIQFINYTSESVVFVSITALSICLPTFSTYSFLLLLCQFSELGTSFA